MSINRQETGRSLAPARPGSTVQTEIGAPGFEPGTSPTRTVRATRLRHAPRLPVLRKAPLRSAVRPHRGRHTPRHGRGTPSQGRGDALGAGRRCSGSPSRSAGIALLALSMLLDRAASDRDRRCDPGRHRVAARGDPRPRARRRAWSCWRSPSCTRCLVSDRDPRRGGRLRLRLLGRAAAGHGRLAAQRDRRLLDRPPRGPAAALSRRRARSASCASSGSPSTGA